MNTKSDKFFILTNPIFWACFFIMFIYHCLDMFCSYIGIKDWYWVIFKLSSMSIKDREELTKVNSIRQTKFFWLKEKAWERAEKIISNKS